MLMTSKVGENVIILNNKDLPSLPKKKKKSTD